jgi:hypothetical protein
MAGPLHSIGRTGGCGYVYTRDDVYFRGVNDPDALLERLMTWHRSLAEEVGRFVPTTPSQRVDHEYMRLLISRMHSPVERGCEIERDRLVKE